MCMFTRTAWVITHTRVYVSLHQAWIHVVCKFDQSQKVKQHLSLKCQKIFQHMKTPNKKKSLFYQPHWTQSFFRTAITIGRSFISRDSLWYFGWVSSSALKFHKARRRACSANTLSYFRQHRTCAYSPFYCNLTFEMIQCFSGLSYTHLPVCTAGL